MSEERFEFYSDEDLIGVIDTVTGRTFNSFEIVDVLNELMEKEIIIVLEDDFGRAMTSIKIELSPPQLLEKIMEWFGEKYE